MCVALRATVFIVYCYERQAVLHARDSVKLTIDAAGTVPFYICMVTSLITMVSPDAQQPADGIRTDTQ